MRIALATHDIRSVYRLLQRHGVPQRLIAALTDQSQSEVSEVLAGKRRVVSYYLLIRIADGLGVPRGWMGLASDEDLQARPDASKP
jgi:transcriptional regulator with XRE-family HTH domain